MLSGRAGPAAIYPRKQCETICRGLANQKRLDSNGLILTGKIVLDVVATHDPEWMDSFHEVDAFHMEAGVFE